MARPIAMGDKVSAGDWSPYTAETINNLFERLYKAVADLSGTDSSSAATALANGLDALVPSANDLIVGIAGGKFGLLSFDSTVQRSLVNDGGAPGWGQVDLSTGVTGAIDIATQTTGLLDLTTRVTGILPIPNGGTGLSAVAQGDFLYGSAANVLSRLAKSATASRYLANTGTSNNPAWDQVDLSNGIKNRLSALTSLPQFATTERVWGLNAAAPGDASELSISQLLDWLGSTAQGDLPYRDSSTWANLAHGTSGQFLQTQGASANPKWADVITPSGNTALNANGLYVAVIAAGSISTLGVMGFAPVSGTFLTTSGGIVVEESSVYVALTTTAATNATAFVTLNNVAGTQIIDWSLTFDVTFRIRTAAALTNQRYWIGFCPSNPTSGNSDTASVRFVGFRLSSTASDTGFVGVCNDGTTQSVTSALNTIAASTKYDLRVRSNGSSAFFSINGGAETQLSTNFPTGATRVGPEIRVQATNNAAHTLDFNRLFGIVGV